jgi:hypothetical protein
MLSQSQLHFDNANLLFHRDELIEVTNGPLISLKDNLINLKGINSVAVQLQHLNISIFIVLPPEFIQKIISR